MDSSLAGRPVLKPMRCIAKCSYIYSVEKNDHIAMAKMMRVIFNHYVKTRVTFIVGPGATQARES